MVMSFFMHMPVVEFLGGWIAQGYHLYREMQFGACERMIEIEADSIVIETIHKCRLGISILIGHVQFETLFEGQVFWKFTAGNVCKRLLVEFTVSLLRRDDHVFTFADLHAHHFLFKPRDDISISHKELQRAGLI